MGTYTINYSGNLHFRSNGVVEYWSIENAGIHLLPITPTLPYSNTPAAF